MNPGGTPIFEGTLCKALKTPFYAHSSSSYPWKVCSVTQRSDVFWFFDQKLHLSHNNSNVFFIFLITRLQVCSKYAKLSQISIRTCDKTHFVWNFLERPTFCVKSHFSPVGPFFSVVFASPNAPYFGNWDRTPVSIL